MTRISSIVVVLFILASCSTLAGSRQARETSRVEVLSSPTNTSVLSSIKVLFIGNSYTYGNDLPQVFAALASSGGNNVEVGIAAEGSWRLYDHAQSPETLEKLKSTPWTYVVLQEQSQIPSLEIYRTQSMYPAARELVTKIRELDATPIFFLTWGHRDGWPERGMEDYESMQTNIEDGYLEIAQELNVPVAPVGSAWRSTVQQHPELNLWREDGMHPSRQGTYLAACVFYATIFQESPAGLGYYLDLSPESAQSLQRIASKAVLGTP